MLRKMVKDAMWLLRSAGDGRTSELLMKEQQRADMPVTLDAKFTADAVCSMDKSPSGRQRRTSSPGRAAKPRTSYLPPPAAKPKQRFMSVPDRLERALRPEVVEDLPQTQAALEALPPQPPIPGAHSKPDASASGARTSPSRSRRASLGKVPAEAPLGPQPSWRGSASSLNSGAARNPDAGWSREQAKSRSLGQMLPLDARHLIEQAEVLEEAEAMLQAERKMPRGMFVPPSRSHSSPSSTPRTSLTISSRRSSTLQN